MIPTEVARDLFLVPLPLPFALRSVNCYLLRDPAGWTVLDTGLHTADGESAWRAAFVALGVSPRDIHQIVLTHFHPDHFGMAGWLQAQCDAPVYMAPREIVQAQQLWGNPDEFLAPIAAQFAEHGVPLLVAETIADVVSNLRAATLPHPKLLPLSAGAQVSMGDRLWTAIHAPGHSDGQLIFYDENDRLLLCGDHVLLKITPHIGVWPDSEPDPLGRYLASLAELESLDVRLALPGHGRQIEHWASRLRELRQHHAERLEAMRAAVGRSATAYKVATRTFDFARYTPHEIRFAVAETIAHLDLLVARNLLLRVAGDVVRYTA